MTFYARDLARIHDEGFGDFARAAATELLRRLREPGLVVELGSGSGISSAMLADAGHTVVGIDASAEMLELARERVPAATFVRASAWGVELPSGATAVTAFGEVLNYTNAGSGALAPMFARVHAALTPGGLFLFDVATPGRGTGETQADGHTWTIASRTTEHDDGTLTRHMTFTCDGRKGEETHVLRLHDRREIRDALEQAGFAVEALHSYAEFAFWPGYIAFAATKPG